MMSAIISLLGKYRSVLIAVKYHNYGFFVGIWNQNSLKKEIIEIVWVSDPPRYDA